MQELFRRKIKDDGVIEIHVFLGDLKTGNITHVEIETVGNPEKRLIPWDDYVRGANHLLRRLFQELLP